MIKAYRKYLVKRTTESLLELRSQTSKYNVSDKADNDSLWLTVKSPYFGFYDLKWDLKGTFDTKEYYDSIKAPEKKMELMKGCGHYPQYEDTDAFCKTLKDMLDSFLSQDG